MDEWRDLPIILTNALFCPLQIALPWKKEKRCDVRLASKGEPAPPWRGETFSNHLIYNSTLRLTAMGGRGGYNFFSFANLRSSFLLPLVSNSTVAVLFGTSPSIDLIVPFPNLSCSTWSPSVNSDESLPV